MQIWTTFYDGSYPHAEIRWSGGNKLRLMIREDGQWKWQESHYFKKVTLTGPAKQVQELKLATIAAELQFLAMHARHQKAQADREEAGKLLKRIVAFTH